MTSFARPLDSPALRTRLAELLDAELDFSAEAQGGFVNHLPMTLVAAAGLGASDAQLIGIYEAQSQGDFLRTRPRPPYLEPLTREVERRGARATVADHIAPLLAAVDARWFHAVIRLEHALDALHAAQVAHALGDWAEVATPLPDLPSKRGSESLVSVARRFQDIPALTALGKQRLRVVATHPEFVRELSRARLGPHAIEDAAELALHAHMAGHDFTTLHLVTGARAAQSLAQHLPPELVLVLGERIAQAVLAGYLCRGSGSLPTSLGFAERRSRELPEWTTLAQKAFESGDAHLIKLTYACLRQERHTGEVLYRWLAARDLGAIEEAGPELASRAGKS